MIKLNYFLVISIFFNICAVSTVFSENSESKNSYSTAFKLYQEGQYFKAARYAFASINPEINSEPDSESSKIESAITAKGNALIAMSLTKAGLYQSASYFFLRTLQLQNNEATQSVLQVAPELSIRLGSDLIRKILADYTRLDQYSPKSRDIYFYIIAKEALLRGQAIDAVKAVNEMQPGTQFGSYQLYPYALQIRATANALLNKDESALRDFKECEEAAISLGESISELSGKTYEAAKLQLERREAIELASRCQAGVARVYYQAGQFREAEKAWDRISKNAYVWPEILFEQGWNAFALKSHNRVLGKLVSYKSPSLQFLFNSEIDVLRAMSLMSLCLYDDTNQVINEFNQKYSGVGEKIKSLVESKSDDMKYFYNFGKSVLKESLYTQNDVNRVANRFVRSPYFENIQLAETAILSERQAIARFSSQHANQTGEAGLKNTKEGFPGFLGEVLNWRMRTIEHIGGAFIKNSLMDYHSTLLSDFEKIAFIKLEMLGKAKMALQGITSKVGTKDSDRERGNQVPRRRDDQYYWSFNGEFWNDELGDYVFGLESKCGEIN